MTAHRAPPISLGEVKNNMDYHQAKDASQKYLEDLLSFFGINTIVKIEENLDDEENSVINLSVPSTHLNGFLIGLNGDTLRSIQHLVNIYISSSFDGVSPYKINVDIAGYKKQRTVKVEEFIDRKIEEFKLNKQPIHLEPMNSYERRVAHQKIADAGLKSESEGYGRDRHIVISE
jgi:spoIIIJ-associated protein